MLLELLAVDKPCAEVFIDSWKEMVATTASRDKSCLFATLDDYVDYRIIDTGAPFVSKLMCFGMGIQLTDEEWKLAAPITRSCFAALGLVNDYFSFDVEWDEYQREGKNGQNTAMTNLVWLYIQWEDLSIPEAKERTRETVRHYEAEYYQRVNAFSLDGEKCSMNLEIYLKAQAYQISGNVAWSLRCPRYHPELCAKGQDMLHSQAKENKQKWQREDHSTKNPDPNERPVSDLAGISDSETSQQSPAGTPRSSVSSSSSVYSVVDSADLPEFESSISLSDKALLAPFEYISSLPSKGMREALIDALNVWLILPDSTIKTIKRVSQKLHSSSLMLDDIEDSSDLRRGHPATHTVFGAASTINSANSLLVDVMNDVLQLNNPDCMKIVTEELHNLFIGQSWDLHWTQQFQCPSEVEYLEMISHKTGGLFRLLARLMNECSSSLHNKSVHLNKNRHLTSFLTLSRTIPLDFITVLGQYFQIRDDFKNLTDHQYTTEKGFCEDLDEGKFSFPIVHAWQSDRQDFLLRGIMRTGRSLDSLSIPHKKTILAQLDRHGSMRYTLRVLRELEKIIRTELNRIEQDTKCENWVMRLLIQKLAV
ncbi:isoprenoid synthase domain-containing protein [Penicillium hetheringtonii]|uniref:Isoprenoid synthase domain-containing protein n=1 Tax=Penicillium hetheringtonii TaxID=911720 RepID=A0AAD6GU14_9EURO|nr:isoprenoid synthase domain-containing protein [Penicillium hetheringtonii]